MSYQVKAMRSIPLRSRERSRDGTARIWAADGTPGDILEHGEPVKAVAIAPDGTWLVTIGGWTAHLWAADGTPRGILKHDGTVKAVGIAPDGTWLVTASRDRTARIWAVTQSGGLGADLCATLDLGRPAGAVAIAPDGAWLVTFDAGAVIWAVRRASGLAVDGRAALDHGYPIGEGDYVVPAVAIAPDGTWLATTRRHGAAQIWAADGTPGAILKHHRTVNAVAIAPDGTWLVTASRDGTARIWAADGTPGDILEHGEPVKAVAIAPDGTWLVTIGGKTAQLWAANGTASL